MQSSTSVRPAPGDDRGHVESLITRYPQISPEEQREILLFLKKAPAIEIGLLSCNDEVKPRLEQFRNDHRRQLGAGPAGVAIGLVALIALAMLVYLLWDVGVQT